MKLYISGPITGCEDGNKPKFNFTSKMVRKMGFTAINPWDLELVEPRKGWTDNMKRDIKFLSECDGVVLLKGWEQSKGARLEVIVAYSLGMKFYRWDKLTQDLRFVPIVVEEFEITPLITSDQWDGGSAND